MRTVTRLLPRPQLFSIAIIVALMTPLSSFGATLSSSASSLRFGNAPVKTTVSKSMTLTNKGTGTVTVSKTTVTGAFKVTSLTTPVSLAAGKSVTFTVQFLPTTSGILSGKLTVTSNAPTLSVALSGIGLKAGSLAFSPSTISFGSVTVGSTATKTAYLRASNSHVYISAATTSNPEFTLSGIKLPLTIAGGASVPVTVTFKPGSSGATSGKFSLASNAVVSPTTASASGSGIATAQHTVTLKWTPSTSSVTGYRVYRGTATGGPYSSLSSSTLVSASYVDTSVQSGKTYFYVTTAVNSSGVESVKSNEVKAAIPTP